MLWLIVLGLAVWCVFLEVRMGALRGEFEVLRRGIFNKPLIPSLIEPTATTAPVAEAPDPTAEDLPVAAKEVFDSPAAAEAYLRAEAARATPRVAEHPPVSRPAPAAPAAPPAAPQRSIGDWLSENGIAWIGGGALALGGLLLVAYAAERGFFSPLARIWSAAVLGFVSLGVGEALRRGKIGAAPNPLVAALTTAAGAAILYGAVWAAFGLYSFIPAWTAAVLLTVVSLGLLGLAFLHGEPLGVLAILGAFAVPMVSGVGAWRGPALDAYAVLITLTGLAAFAVRYWRATGAVTLAGVFIWALARWVESDAVGVAVLASVAVATSFAASAANRRWRPSEADAPRQALLVLAILGAGFLGLILRMSAGAGPAMATVASLVMVAAIALGARMKLNSERLLIVPAALTVTVALLSYFDAPHVTAVLWLVAGVAGLAAAGFACTLSDTSPIEPAVITAAGSALAMTFAAPALSRAAPGWDWAIDLGLAASLAAATAALAGKFRGAQPIALAAWIAVSAEVTGLALHAGLIGSATPTAYAVLGLALAGLSVGLKWRGFAESAAVACLASFGALLTLRASPDQVSVLNVLLVAGPAVLVQVAVWQTVKRHPQAATSVEAVSTLAVMTALLGAFQALQALAAPHSPLLLGEFARASARTVLLVAAGLMLSIRGAATPLGRYRAPAFLALGALHGLLLEGLLINPWWGAFTKPVAGPPIVDVIAVGLLAPALILIEAARRASRADRRFAGVAFAAGLAFVVLWIVTEIRRVFHGPDLTAGPVRYEEIAAYAAAFLALGFGLEAARARLVAVFGDRSWLTWALEAVSWAGLGLALILLADVASPWWGPLDGAVRAPLLLGLFYALACAFGVGLTRIARRSGRVALSRVATIATGVELFVLLTLAVRWGFHGGDMRAALAEGGVETWSFSAAWALYGFAALALGAQRRDFWLRGFGLVVLLGATAKVFLFDLAQLEGVIRAGSFLVLGVVLLVSALAARQLRGGRKVDGPD
jgi:uncharacterized membrane protein